VTDKIDYEDVDDIIAAAERLRADAEDDLTPQELADIGAELGIPAEYVEQARQKLEARRAKHERDAKRREKRRAKIALVAGAVILSAGAIFGLWSYSSLSGLRDAYALVEQQRAQVDNVRDRKAAIERQFEGREPSLEKDAELIGAQNRLRVEIKRLNEAAAHYNRQARGFPASLWTGSEELPEQVEMAPTTH
jgi:cell division protein FtsB